MMYWNIKKLAGLSLVLFSSTLWAENTIQVQVRTEEASAAALGFKVEGKKSGGRGKVYIGKGPANKTYIFGYRKNFAYGRDVLCGSEVLTHDSIVTLVTDGEQCSIKVN
ncbi:MAG: hypothetical protein J0I93_03985 [Legionella sp.]|nr:hypothetical protein [Legionella sp.]